MFHLPTTLLQYRTAAVGSECEYSRLVDVQAARRKLLSWPAWLPSTITHTVFVITKRKHCRVIKGSLMNNIVCYSGVGKNNLITDE